jgi:hypothetical protein
MYLERKIFNKTEFSSVINLIFKGQMEYAIISFSVGEKTCSWLFHALLFINSLLIFSGINACFAGIFYGSHGITHIFLIFTGVRELKVRHENNHSGW